MTITDNTTIIKPAAAIADPRVFFAAERTLLAWVRSGLAIIAIGFVVAKFGLFLQLLTAQYAQKAASQTAFAHYLGFALVLSGVLVVLLAQYNHQHFLKTLMPQDIPYQAIKHLPTLLTSLVSLMGIVLASYLIIT